MSAGVQSDNRRTAELWFRGQGLPAIVRGRQELLLVRIVPAVAFLLVTDLFFLVLDVINGDTEAEYADLTANLLLWVAYHVVWLASFVVPAVAAWLAARWTRGRVVAHTGTPVAVAVIGFEVVGMPLLSGLFDPEFDGAEVAGEALSGAVGVVILLGLTWIGFGAVFGWALRSSLEQTRALGTLTTRALPLLLLFNVFGVLTNEVWQMSASLGTGQMWVVVGMFALVGVLFLISTGYQELQLMADHGPDDLAHELRGTPFAAEAATQAPRTPMGRLERANMVLILVLTHMIQALLVAIVMFVFFVMFGLAAVNRDLMKTWSGHDLTTGKLFDMQVAVPQELLQVSLFIAAFSALYFTASSITDQLYRTAFFEPLTKQLAVSVAARDVYLARWSASSPQADKVAAAP